MLGISVPIPHSHAAHLQRHGTCTHTGYPFMQLAKETGADYGDVLLYADAVQCTDRSWSKNGAESSCTVDHWMHMVDSVDVKIRARIVNLVALPVHLRGGNHD